MRVAVTGTTGRVGAALQRYFAKEHEVIPLPRSICDLADARSLDSALKGLECDVFLNPGGLTSLEACEDNPALAMRVNAAAPGEIAAWAARRGIPVFHFSTDYVFAGDGETLLRESDVAQPINVYGKSKLAGENAVLAWPGNCVIRVSWIFGPEKPSFIDQIAGAALAGRPLNAIADKFSLPVFTDDLVGWIDKLLRAKARGIVHACNSGEAVSWHDMATATVGEMLDCGAISTFPEIGLQTLASMTSFRAMRPRFTAMDTTRLSGFLGHAPRHWREALSDHVRRSCSPDRRKHHPGSDRKMI